MNMKRFLPLLAAFAMLHLSTSARAADAGACYTISNSDARAHSIAKARKDPGMCYAVSRPDLRAACLAEVRR